MEMTRRWLRTAALALCAALPLAACGDDADTKTDDGPAPATDAGAAGEPSKPPARDGDKIARTQMANLGTAVDMYKLSNRRFPNSLEVLAEPDARTGEPYIDKIPQDPWGNDYEYRLMSRREYQIRSGGRDGEFDTDDDVVHPERK